MAAYCELEPRFTVAGPVTETATAEDGLDEFEPLLAEQASRKRTSALTVPAMRLRRKVGGMQNSLSQRRGRFSRAHLRLWRGAGHSRNLPVKSCMLHRASSSKTSFTSLVAPRARSLIAHHRELLARNELSGVIAAARRALLWHLALRQSDKLKAGNRSFSFHLFYIARLRYRLYCLWGTALTIKSPPAVVCTAT